MPVAKGKSGLLLLRVGFTEAVQQTASWREWAASDWVDGALDFYHKAAWLSEDCAAAWFVILDAPFYRRRLLALQGNEDVADVTITPLEYET